ncbi:hypothetical protein M8494_19820 [Serratia ureilytica]
MAGCCGAPGLLSRASRREPVRRSARAVADGVLEIIAARDPDAIVLGDLPRGASATARADKIAFLEHHPHDRDAARRASAARVILPERRGTLPPAPAALGV